MDCHVFRRLCDELAPALMGCRIEKIHRPAKDVTLFTPLRHRRQTFPVSSRGPQGSLPFPFDAQNPRRGAHRRPISCGCANTLRIAGSSTCYPTGWGAAFTFMSTPIPNAGLRSICGKAPRCFSTRRLSLKFRHGPIPRTGPKPVKATAGGTGRSSRRPCAVPSLCSRPTSKQLCSSIWRPAAGIFSFTKTPPGIANFPHGPCRPNGAGEPTGAMREELVSKMPSGLAPQPGKRRFCAASRPSRGPKPPSRIRPRPTACASSCSSWRARRNASAAWSRLRTPPACSKPSFTVSRQRKNGLRHAGRAGRAFRA